LVLITISLLEVYSFAKRYVFQGQGQIEEFPVFQTLKNSWFYRYYDRLCENLEEIHLNMAAANYDYNFVQKIPDMLDEICLEVGIIVKFESDEKGFLVRLTDLAQFSILLK
jgi:hypothetical protein